MDLSIRPASRDDSLNPSLRNSITAVEAHLSQVTKALATLDPAAIDLVSHGIVLSSMPASFITTHLFNILRLAISAMAIVPDAAPLCEAILEPMAHRLPFPTLAPLLVEQDLGLLLSLESHPAIAQLLLGIFTRVAPTGLFEMQVVWHAYIAPQRKKIVELWILHPEIHVSQAAEDCIVAFILAAFEYKDVEAMALFEDIVCPKPDTEPAMFSLIRDSLNRPPLDDVNTDESATDESIEADVTPVSNANFKTADALTALGRVQSLLPRILPSNPVAIFKSGLMNLALTCNNNPEDEMLVHSLRAEVMVLCLRALFNLQVRDGSLPPGTIRVACEMLQRAKGANPTDSNNSVESDMRHRLSRDWGDEDEKRFRQWVALAFGIDS
ncbi:hypothetical protein BROUX41_000551 [Berkeleyomyces rouxiae]|uniref:uncharacterized protein n=1 Tax=Berkeleyomyces rouxiae TaxID=2035830 RepID=UPI003B7CB48B